MKLSIPLPDDTGKTRIFCRSCQRESVRETSRDAARRYVCGSCGHEDVRALVFGKNALMHTDREGTLWHETVAVFVFDGEGKILCFERTNFPIGLVTIPAGHAERGQSILDSAKMELEEESGISGCELEFLGKRSIPGDSCSWGADDHIWHVFTVHVDKRPDVRLNHEGKNLLWLLPREILERDAVIGVRIFLEEYFRDSL